MNISVLVLSYNTKDLTDECLTRLKGQGAEVIVVDNASTDGSPEMIAKKHKEVRLIVSKVNTGFGGGNNLAFKQARGDLVLILNSDALVEKDTIRKTTDFFMEHPECDVLGCQLRFGDGRLQPSAGAVPTPLNTLAWMVWFDRTVHPQDPAFFEKPKQVGWVMGAFMCMKREVYKKTGGFDENYFMYGEEIELCKRIGDLGYKVWYTPEFSVTHLDKGSAKGDVVGPIIKELQGLKYYFSKHYPKFVGMMVVVLRLGIFIRIMLKSKLYKLAKI